MKSALRKKFGLIQQQNIHQTAVSLTGNSPSYTDFESFRIDTEKEKHEDEISEIDCVAVRDEYPENVQAGTRVFICIFSRENPVTGTMFYIWKYPNSDLTCNNLLTFPFFLYSGQQNIVDESLDEIRTAFPVSQQGYSGHILYNESIVLFFSTDFIARKDHSLSIFAVAREEIENIGHVHGWSVHESVRKIIDLSDPYLGKAKPMTALRVFYRKSENFDVPSQIEPLVRPCKEDNDLHEERIICFVGNTKYVFSQENEDIYEMLWNAWSSGYDSVYIGGCHGNLWFLRHAHQAYSLSII